MELRNSVERALRDLGSYWNQDEWAFCPSGFHLLAGSERSQHWLARSTCWSTLSLSGFLRHVYTRVFRRNCSWKSALTFKDTSFEKGCRDFFNFSSVSKLRPLLQRGTSMAGHRVQNLKSWYLHNIFNLSRYHIIMISSQHEISG